MTKPSLREALRIADLLASPSLSWRFTCQRWIFRILDIIIWSTCLPLLAQTPQTHSDGYSPLEKGMATVIVALSSTAALLFKMLLDSQTARIKDMEASRAADLKHAEATMHVSNSLDEMASSMKEMTAQFSRVISVKLGR